MISGARAGKWDEKKLELKLTDVLADPNTPDVIEEALDLFRANCLFRNFEIKGKSSPNPKPKTSIINPGSAGREDRTRGGEDEADDL